MTLARIVIAVSALSATVGLLLVEGLSTTSALIEVGMFIVATGAWVFAGTSALNASRASAERIRTKKGHVNITQTAATTHASDVDADGDVTIKQQSG